MTNRMRTAAPWPESVKAAVIEVIDRATAEAYERFMALPFVSAWRKQHDRFGLDESDMLGALQVLLSSGLVGIGAAEKVLSVVDRIGISIEGPQRKAAPLEPKIHDDRTGLHYVVHGHTHHFDIVPLGASGNQDKVYFNSGTFRTRCMRAENRRDFVAWKLMGYLVFYGRDEDGDGREEKGLSFEAWQGTALRGSV